MRLHTPIIAPATAFAASLLMTSAGLAQTARLPSPLMPPLSPASLNAPFSGGSSRSVETERAGIGLAYTSWPSAAEQTRSLSYGVLSFNYEPNAANTDPQSPLERARGMGLGGVRFKVNLLRHMDSMGEMDRTFLDQLEGGVNAALDAGATVILSADNTVECSKLPRACAPMLIDAWGQVGERFANAPTRLMFELLTAPGGNMTAETWNGVSVRIIDRVRETNPLRNLIVPPAAATGKGSDLAALNALSLPEADTHLIIALPFGDPMAAEALPNRALLGIKPLRAPEEATYVALDGTLNELAAWSRLKGRPVLLTEVGADDPEQMRYRTRWVSTAIRLAASKGMGWGLGEGARKLKASDLDLQRVESAVQTASDKGLGLSSVNPR